MVDLGTDDNISVSGAVGIEMKPRCAFLPAPVVGLDLTCACGAQGNTQRVAHIDTARGFRNRAVQTRNDHAVKVVGGLGDDGGVFVSDEAHARYTLVRNIGEGLGQTVVRRETQIRSRGLGFVLVRVEIDGVVPDLNTNHQLLADEFGPDLLFPVFPLVVVEDDLVFPLLGAVRGVGQNDEMFVCYHYTRDLEGGCLFRRGDTVELVGSRIVFYVRGTTVSALISLDLALLVFVEIVGRIEFGTVHRGQEITRPALG